MTTTILQHPPLHKQGNFRDESDPYSDRSKILDPYLRLQIDWLS
jgi:hypothetical protein